MKLNRLLFISLLLVNTTVLALPTAKITVKVVDEQGNPVEGAKIGIGLMSSKDIGQGWGTKSSRVKGLTDGDGIFFGEGETEPYLSFSATKEGYYGSSGKFKAFTGVSGILGFRTYEPWNPTVELILKKIINPIPMYAVRMSTYQKKEHPDIPTLDRFVGFDLSTNDWVVPHGLGTHHDFMFKVEVKRAVSYDNYDTTITLKFSNPGDGLIKYTPDVSKGKSMLRLPHHAPVTGYKPEYVKRYEHSPDVIQDGGAGGDQEFGTNYFFRVRTELDKDGNVIAGLYGKIHGEIKLHNYTLRLKNRNPFLSFNYYLNPNNNDTNIEFDPKRNLFKGLPDRKKVSEP